MTVLGKILAILNLVLSLLVGAFIVMTYAARTNWHAAYLNMEKQAKVSQADATAFKKEMELAKGEKAQREEELAKYKDATDKEKQALNAQITDYKDKLKQAGEENAKHVAAESAAAAELTRRGNEGDYLKTLIAARDAQLTKKEGQVEQMRAAMVGAQINYNAEHERNERLLQENERLSKDNRQIRQVATSTSPRTEAPKRNPPDQDIEGRVKATDRGGYVTVNVGSDAGLGKGNTLEVYRLDPPAYLGTIQIVAVLPNEAVAKPVDRLRGAIQVGDQVSSNIMNRH